MEQIATRKIKYFSLQKKPFEAGDTLLFNLYVVENKKARLFYKANNKLNLKEIHELTKYEKVYINFDDLGAYKKYFYQKKAPKTEIKKDISLDAIAKALHSHVRHIYTHSLDPHSVKKIYPWISNLVNTMLQSNTKYQELFHLITKDYKTCTHSLNVAIYAALLGKEVEMPKSELKKLILSAMLHDIGKIKIDDKILYKKEPLTPHELKIIRMHATMGYTIVKSAGITDKKILSGIHHHHERLDGSGYPNGFKSIHVSEFARIIAICDTYAAMSSNRAHKEPKQPFEILTEMKKDLKGKLDGDLINHFIKALT